MNEVVAIKNSSETAFVKVYQQFHAKTFRYFLRRVKESGLAAELTQQAFIKLWQSRHTLSERHTIETQLMTIAGSILVDHIRRQAHENRLRTALAYSMQIESQSSAEGASQAKVFENSDYLNAVIDRLPPVRKKIMRLRMINGLSNKEIAGLLDISSKTVEDHVTKAVKFVRSIDRSFIMLVPLLALQG